MKPNRMTSIIAKSVAVLAACAALNASAGTAPAKGPLPPMEPEPAALFDTIGATLDVGYDSRYYFRGLYFADNIVWSALNIAIPLIGGGSEDAGSLTWNIGAAYISSVQTPANNPAGNGFSKSAFDYSELDLITSLVYDAGFAKFGLQYQNYWYPDTYSGSFNGVGLAPNDPEFGISGAGEIGLTVAIPLGAANFYLGAYHDFRIGGEYFQAGVDYTIPVTDWMSIVPAVQTGYGINYYTGTNNQFTANGGFANGTTQSSGFTHILASVSTPIKLTKIATLTPYVAWNFALQTRNYLNATHDNEIFGGVKLSLAF
jgi:hypothetical protein